MTNKQDKLAKIQSKIATYPDFPQAGVSFKDIFSVLNHPETFSLLNEVLIEEAKSLEPQCIVGLDARGFLFGPLIALALKVPFVPIRKKGKLPGVTKSVSYTLEYGQGTIEIQQNAIEENQRVLIVDDLLATGGTLKASCELVSSLKGLVCGCLVVMELEGLKGREIIPGTVRSLVTF